MQIKLYNITKFPVLSWDSFFYSSWIRIRNTEHIVFLNLICIFSQFVSQVIYVTMAVEIRNSYKAGITDTRWMGKLLLEWILLGLVQLPGKIACVTQIWPKIKKRKVMFVDNHLFCFINFLKIFVANL